jgi:hypothetical protein
MKVKFLSGIVVLQLLYQGSLVSSDVKSSLGIVATRIVLPTALQLKTIDHLYPIIKNNQGVEALAMTLDGLDHNQTFSERVVTNFQAGEDAQGLTPLQLAVLCDRVDMVAYLLRLPDIQVNETDQLRATLDYADFYNVIPTSDPDLSLRRTISEMLVQHGAQYSEQLKELLKTRHAFSMKLRKLDI